LERGEGGAARGNQAGAPSPAGLVWSRCLLTQFKIEGRCYGPGRSGPVRAARCGFFPALRKRPEAGPGLMRGWLGLFKDSGSPAPADREAPRPNDAEARFPPGAEDEGFDSNTLGGIPRATSLRLGPPGLGSFRPVRPEKKAKLGLAPAEMRKAVMSTSLPKAVEIGLGKIEGKNESGGGRAGWLGRRGGLP